jgi:lysyl-tRNA synthetase class 2
MTVLFIVNQAGTQDFYWKNAMWWKETDYAAKKPYLKARMVLIQAVRAFFDGQGFCEVETPALQVSPGMEPHLHAFRTTLLNPERDSERTLYLHTSPEFAMKKLLVAGWPRIYQICHVFRNAEGSRLHSPEFTMIEWYRAHAGYRDIMADCEGLLRAVATALGIEAYRYRGISADPFVEWEYITVCEAFEKYAGIDLASFLFSLPQAGGGDVKELRAAMREAGLHTALDDTFEDLIVRVLGELIEPKLGQGRPTILYDYPVSMAALSRPKPEDPRFAERFELYICGVELANAFGELTDPVAQRARFEADMALKQKLYGETWPVDEEFIAALEHGMPESGGIALGIDRLAMLATGAEEIGQVLWITLF